MSMSVYVSTLRPRLCRIQLWWAQLLDCWKLLETSETGTIGNLNKQTKPGSHWEGVALCCTSIYRNLQTGRTMAGCLRILNYITYRYSQIGCTCVLMNFLQRNLSKGKVEFVLSSFVSKVEIVSQVVWQGCKPERILRQVERWSNLVFKHPQTVSSISSYHVGMLWGSSHSASTWLCDCLPGGWGCQQCNSKMTHRQCLSHKELLWNCGRFRTYSITVNYMILFGHNSHSQCLSQINPNQSKSNQSTLQSFWNSESISLLICGWQASALLWLLPAGRTCCHWSSSYTNHKYNANETCTVNHIEIDLLQMMNHDIKFAEKILHSTYITLYISH